MYDWIPLLHKDDKDVLSDASETGKAGFILVKMRMMWFWLNDDWF